MKKGKLGGDSHTLSLSHNPLVCVWRCRRVAAARPGTIVRRYWLVSTVRSLGLPDSTVQSSAAACQCVSRPLGSVQYRRALLLLSPLADISLISFFPLGFRGGISCFVLR